MSPLASHQPRVIKLLAESKVGFLVLCLLLVRHVPVASHHPSDVEWVFSKCSLSHYPTIISVYFLYGNSILLDSVLVSCSLK